MSTAISAFRAPALDGALDQPAAPHPAVAVPASTRFPVTVLAIMLWSSVLLQKIALPGNIELPLVIMVVGLGVLVGRGWAKVSLPRLSFLALLIAAMAISQAVAPAARSFSLESMMLAVPLYAMFVLLVPLDRPGIVAVLRHFQRVASFIAAMVALQWAMQLAGVPIPNVDEWIAPQYLYHLFNYVQPLTWGAHYMKPNAFFMLEASHTSQILAMGAVIEICVFRRLWMAIGLICAQLASFGGTGLVLLLACLPLLPFYLSRRTVLGLLGGAVLIAAGVSQTPIWHNFSQRSAELGKPNSSGNGRFVEPYRFMVETLTSSPTAIVSGIGPGNGKESTDRSEQLVMNPMVKAVVEYGLFVGVIWMVFIHACVLRTAAPGIVAVAVLIQYDFLNGSLLVPIHLVYCYILAGAYARGRVRGTARPSDGWVAAADRERAAARAIA
jgi:hypothetical protein